MNISSVILAAGFSSRANAFKMTLPFKEKTVLQCCIDSLSNVSDEIVVVTGFKHEIISELLKNERNINIVHNKSYKDGMFSSLKVGIKNVKGDKFFFTPGDYPIISEATYKTLLKFNGDVCIPIYKGKKGHPVLIDSKHINDILNNSKYNSLRDFVHSKSYSLVEVDDMGILQDIDTYDDYLSLVNS